MKLVAWDTSAKSGALVALEWDPRSRAGWTDVRLVAELTLNVDVTHSERLLWAVDQMLQASRWKLEDIDLLGVGVGPGSFTGLRIGVTTARTLAHTLKRPLIGVSSLAALARPAAQWLSHGFVAKPRATVIAATDAAKGELFALWGAAKSVVDCAMAADDLTPRGLWKRGVEEQVLEPGALVRAVKRKLRGKSDFWIAVGEGRSRYPEAWKQLPRRRELAPPAPFPAHVQGRYLGQLAWEAYQAGLAREALQVHPRYLRASDAEIKLRAGLLAPAPVEPRGA